MTLTDGMYLVISAMFQFGLPLFMGTLMVRDAKELEDLLRFLVKAGLDLRTARFAGD